MALITPDSLHNPPSYKVQILSTVNLIVGIGVLALVGISNMASQTALPPTFSTLGFVVGGLTTFSGVLGLCCLRPAKENKSNVEEKLKSDREKIIEYLEKTYPGAKNFELISGLWIFDFNGTKACVPDEFSYLLDKYGTLDKPLREDVFKEKYTQSKLMRAQEGPTLLTMYFKEHSLEILQVHQLNRSGNRSKLDNFDALTLHNIQPASINIYKMDSMLRCDLAVTALEDFYIVLCKNAVAFVGTHTFGDQKETLIKTLTFKKVTNPLGFADEIKYISYVNGIIQLEFPEY